MEIIYEAGIENFAKVYAAYFRGDKRYCVEFVESLSTSSGIDKKWVLIVSSLFGCPVNCKFCDAGYFYNGKLDTDEILAQIDYMIKKQFPNGKIPTKKLKVQFARIGEPAFNDNVLDAIIKIKKNYDAPGYMPCVSTIAPANRDEWFEGIAEINRKIFKGWFQLQFSIHSTNEDYRDYLIPFKKWGLKKIADYGEEFYAGGRKITLNFALKNEKQIDAEKMCKIFNPEIFAIKITPINPTSNSLRHKLVKVFTQEKGEKIGIVKKLTAKGFDVYVSVGALQENEIGSNCGQVILKQKLVTH
jgi:23S rRNA (adenine2503-C2)-methyltransferase